MQISHQNIYKTVYGVVFTEFGNIDKGNEKGSECFSVSFWSRDNASPMETGVSCLKRVNSYKPTSHYV